MELDNQNSRQAYIQLLVETQKKKLVILNQLMDLTTQQDSLLTEDGFLDEAFNTLMDQKNEQINALLKLDDGFEKLYDSVKNELIVNKEKYRAEITSLQGIISEITNMSVKLQALEKRNKAKVESILTSKRMEIKNARMSNQTVTNYYKSMAQQQESQSYFYDKKK